MPQLPPNDFRTQPVGPIGGRRASAEDFYQGNPGAPLQVAAEAGAREFDRMRQVNEQREVSRLHARVTDLQTAATRRWMEEMDSADPNDDKVAERFMTAFEEELGKATEDIQTEAGQLYFEKASATLRGQFRQATDKGMRDLAEIGAKIDYGKSRDSMTASLLMNPAGFGSAIELHRAGIEGQVGTGRLSTAQGAMFEVEGETDLAKSAIRGWIGKNPADAKARIEAGEWDDYIDGDLKHQLRHEAEIAMKTIDAADAVRDAKAKEARKQQRDLEYGGVLDSILSGNFNEDAMRKAGPGSALEPADRLQLIQVATSFAEMSGRVKTDNALMSRLLQDIRLPKGHEDRIDSEKDLVPFVYNRIDEEAFNFLRREIAMRDEPERQAIKVLEDREDHMAKIAFGVDPATGIADPDGAEMLLKWEYFKRMEEERLISTGVSVAEIHNPQSKYWIMSNLSQFHSSYQQRIQAMVSNLRGDAARLPGTTTAPTSLTRPRRRQGETPVEYKKRMGEVVLEAPSRGGITGAVGDVAEMLIGDEPADIRVSGGDR